MRERNPPPPPPLRTHTAQIQSAHAHPTLAHRSYFRKSEIKDGWRSSYKRSRAIVISNKNSPRGFFFPSFFFFKPHKNPHVTTEKVLNRSREPHSSRFLPLRRLFAIPSSLPPPPLPAIPSALGKLWGSPPMRLHPPRQRGRRSPAPPTRVPRHSGVRGMGGGGGGGPPAGQGEAPLGQHRAPAAAQNRPDPPRNTEGSVPRSAPQNNTALGLRGDLNAPPPPPQNPAGSWGSGSWQSPWRGGGREGKRGGDEARGWKKPPREAPLAAPAAASAHRESWDPRRLRAHPPHPPPHFAPYHLQHLGAAPRS